jgi:hypothetical protein
MDPLPRILEVATQDGLLKSLPGRFIKSCITLYAADLVIFPAPEARDIENLKAMLQNFGKVIGLMINVEKTSVAPIRCDEIDLTRSSAMLPRHAHPIPHQVSRPSEV